MTDITPEILHSIGAEAILLDVDNTLALPGSQDPFPGTIEWSHMLRKAGFRIILLSNNFSWRVQPFAEKYGLPFLSMSMKPFPTAYHRAVRRLGVGWNRAVIAGDQLFTDILGANFAKMKSILLVPVAEEKGSFFRIRRKAEKSIRNKLEKEQRISDKKDDIR